MIRKYLPEDWPEWVRMRQTLWPESDEADAREWLTREDAVTLVAEGDGGCLGGFAEVANGPTPMVATAALWPFWRGGMSIPKDEAGVWEQR